MVTRWRGEGAEPASRETVKPSGSAFVIFLAVAGPWAKAEPARLAGRRAGLRRSLTYDIRAASRDHESRLSSPYLTRHRSWMLCACALGQLASTCRSSGNFLSPYFSIRRATL